MAKKSYQVLRPVEHADEPAPGAKPRIRRHAKGDTIELEDEHAQRLLKSGAIAELPSEPAPKGAKGK